LRRNLTRDTPQHNNGIETGWLAKRKPGCMAGELYLRPGKCPNERK